MREITGLIHVLAAAVVLGVFVTLWLDEHGADVLREIRRQWHRVARGRGSGVTLIELLVVLGVIGILATFISIRGGALRAAAQADADTATAQAMGAALSSYYLANACLPPSAVPGVMPAGMTSYASAWPSNVDYDYDAVNSRGVINLLVSGSWVSQLTVSGPQCP